MSKKKYSLSEAQKRIWTTQQMYPEGSICNIGGHAVVKGKIDIEILKRAFEKLIETNDAFHIRLVFEGKEIKQYFDYENPINIDFIDFSKQENPDKVFERWEEQESRKRFTVENSPLYYVAIYKVASEQYGYFVKLHHIIADGWSIQLISDRLVYIYSKIKNGEKYEYEEHSFEHYLKENFNYQTTQKYINDKKYWNSIFSNVGKNLELPLKQVESIEGKRKTFLLTESACKKIRCFSTQYKISVHVTMMLLVYIYLYKVNGTNDIVIGSPTLGRCSKKERNIIGMFVSSLPIRCDVERTYTILEIAKKLSNRVKESFRHQMYPYGHLIKDLGLSLNGEHKLYDICVNYYHTYIADEIDNIKVENFEFYNGMQDYALQLIIREWSDNDKIQIDFDYQKSYYNESDIENIFIGINTIIDLLPQAENTCLKDICLLNEDEYQSMVIDYNNTSMNMPDAKSIWKLFEDHVQKQEDNIAISHASKVITYKKLHEYASKLANYFHKRFGYNSKSVMGVYMSHSIETVISIMAAIRAGIVYVPIDTSSPIERISKIVSLANINFIVTNIDNVKISDYQGEIIQVEDVLKNVESLEPMHEQCNQENDLIYMIFTSGSTGIPKGVMVKQDGLINYLLWGKKEYKITEQDIFPLFTSLAFDLTVTSILLPLISGASIRVYIPNSGLELESIIKEKICTIIKLTPSHLALLENYNIEETSIQRMILGGEDLKVSVARAIKKKWDNVKIYNEYGPTECTIGCMIYLYDEVKNKDYVSVPIGHPIANTQIYVLDKDFQPVPLNTTGEIYVAGRGLALGYLNDVEMTNAKFIYIPTFKGQQLYKTGDLAKFIDEKTLVYQGRIDKQIKLRGYRVEIGEIERHLSSYDKINTFAIVLQNWGRSEVLCLYYTSNEVIDGEDIRCYLKERLPEYMIPVCYVQLKKIPLTLNGKLDVKSLPKPKLREESTKLEDNPLMAELVDALEAVFGHRISSSSSFYEMGGDSITAIQLSYRLKERGYLLQLKDILTHPVFNEMVYYINRTIVEETMEDINEGGLEPTPIITWFLTQKLYESAFYQAVALKLRSNVTYEQICDVMKYIFKKHDVFNLVYRNDKLEYVKKEIPVVEKVSLKSCSCDEINALQDELANSLDLEKGKLIAMKFCQLPFENILLICIHHLCIDGVSWRILLSEIDMILSGKEQNYNVGSFTFRKYSNGLKNMSTVISLPDEADLFELPKNSDSFMYQTEVSAVELDYMVQNASKTYHTTTFELLLAALVKSIKEETLNQVKVIELESHGREENCEHGFLSTLGWFTVLYPFSIDYDTIDQESVIIQTKENYRKKLKQLKDYAVSHEYCRLRKRPFIKFNYLGDIDLRYGSFEMVPSMLYQGKSTNPVEIDIINMGSVLRILAKVNESIWNQDKVKGFIERYIQNLKELSYYCRCNKIKFTPSDFDTVELSQKEVDELFD